ncbi:hypothetical protein EMPG_16929 [Blastomyces silverae]|uniref:Uncharacterized protein n=1 Tax=Blastomyces silverae TaxID=2060906 RepID=A0A0H1B977_9EURO|nr:hypothetical protein EMPG_16929 [Blastomyces silverae]
MMWTPRTKKNDSHQNGGFQESSSRPVADNIPATVPTSASQPATLRLPPIDLSRTRAPDRRLPPIYPRPGPMIQPQKPAQPPPNDGNIYNLPAMFPTVRPAASRSQTLQSIYLREIEFHCICAARRFWDAHRPQPMLKLVVPNAARPSRPYGSATPWRGINMLTDPAFRDLQQPIVKICHAVNQATKNDDRLGLREYLSLIADLDWDVVRQRQRQQHLTQQDQQNQLQQQQARLQQAEHQQVPPSGHAGNPMLITDPQSTFSPPKSTVADNARRAYSPQFTTVQLLDGLYTSCEAVMNAIQKVNGDGDKEPVELSLAELEGVVSSAKGLALSLNGTMEHHAIGEVWAKCLQSRYP